MCAFPVLLHCRPLLKFLHMLPQPQTPIPLVLQLQGGGSKSLNVAPTVSFLEKVSSKDFSEVGESAVRRTHGETHTHSTEPLNVEFVFDSLDD